MDKKRIEIIITIVLAGILVFIAFKNISKISKKSRVAAPAVSVPPRAYQPPAFSREAKKTQMPVPDDNGTKWSRCPFSGKIYASSSKTEIINLKLTGIVWDESNPQALINGKVVQRFDRVGQFTVIEIYRDKVKLSQNGEYFEIYLAK